MRKVVRDGKVAILYSPGFGAGWYTWNTDYPECIFLPEIIELVENKQKSKITDDLMYDLFGKDKITKDDFYFYTGGAKDLRIEWLPEGTHFDINEYDGSESIQTFDDIKLIA